MSEAEFQKYKTELFERLKGMERDRNGYVWIEEQGGDVDMLGRAMKELNEDGRFRDYKQYISPPKWAVRI
jgi:hypothetical protein